MKSFKRYYIAILVGLVLAYLMLRPSKTTSKTQSQSTGWGSTLTGLGAAGGGLSKLVDSAKGLFSSDSSSADVSTDGEG